ncbi:MAG: RidA family protein [Pseudomonadales bacterium]|uniref:RidA family protein n=1 Tax=Pseudomonas sp. p50(2008) TaxID=2816832 RepID=UPI00188B8FEB|nr:RidA family protein [Pseudomonas sp. p50(2008)]MBF4556500.1 RidA family protein [Pseudomonas sp. p50(2008)]MBH1968492.1 RidA family protein [Pseudomonadales bacterium]MBH2031676.1 RidA family protein [Pseudomonadales bacterium]MBH2076882.1 RidA family protein [Pseudomonadales bacterium]
MIEHKTCDERFIDLAKELGYDIYGENTAGGHYAPLIRHHDELYISGLVPRMNGAIQYPGRVGLELSLSDAQAAASISAMRALALIVDAIGSLDKIKSLVRVTVYVKSTADFVDLSEVANGASDVFSHVLGDAGKHTRTTVGVYQLPKNAAVEVDLIAALRPMPL